MPHRSATELLDEMDELATLLKRKILSAPRKEIYREVATIQNYISSVRRKLVGETTQQIQRLLREDDMGRMDEVTFTCDQEGCEHNVGYHQFKPEGFVPDGWSLTLIDEEDGTQRKVYHCPDHQQTKA